ncbi:MAG: hypothetical protein ABIH35_00855 [Patescibacteria group bacterium]
MTSASDKAPADRNVFRLHSSPKDSQQEKSTPSYYLDLSDKDRLHVAEFSEFILANREDISAGKNLDFYIRDHEKRPATTVLPVPADSPAHYAELDELERKHVVEFINFLRLRSQSKS